MKHCAHRFLPLLALLAVVPASATQSPAPPQPTGEGDSADNPTPALQPLISWADWSGDGINDAWVVQPNGSGLLLESNGLGGFHDRTKEAGLAGVRGAHMAAWADVNGDSRLDLYLPAWRGVSQLYLQQEGGTFSEATRASGLPTHAEPVDAQWIDYDADGAPDLHLVTLVDDLLYRNLGRGQFEKVDLGVEPRSRLLDASGAVPTSVDEARQIIGRPPVGGNPGTSQLGTGISVGPAGTSQDQAGMLVCADTIVDQATGLCIMASTMPTLGELYPISQNLFIDASTGFVGVGTTSPSSRLEVDGNVGAQQYVSTIGTGTPPMDISSRTRVNLLNADFLDGLSEADFRKTADAITAADIADDSVGNSALRNNSVTGIKVQNNSLTQADIAADSIFASELAPDAVASSNVIDGSLNAVDLGSSGVASGDVLKWNGSAWLPTPDLVGSSPWAGFGGSIFYTGGRVGIGTDKPRTSLQVDGSGLLARGGTGSAIPTEGPGIRMMWYPGKAAFRAGAVNLEWDDGGVGTGSAAFNTQNIAGGSNSTAFGFRTDSNGTNTVTMGKRRKRPTRPIEPDRVAS